MQIDEPKIVIIGGSSAGFGINESYIQQATGYPVANLGLHAGFGYSFPVELSKANINAGDIVILAFEWNWYSHSFDTVQADLVMSGIDNHFEMYRYLTKPYMVRSFLKYMPTYVEKRLHYTPVKPDTYSSASFDTSGRMILDRPEMSFVYEGNGDIFGSVLIEPSKMSEKAITYLSDYKSFVESKGANVYFTSCPTYKMAIQSSEEDFLNLIQLEEEKIGIPYISNPSDYFFSDDYMFDTIYHCNTKGELRRSEQLVRDLKNAKVIQ